MLTFDPTTLTKKQSYKLMTGSIVPRPIGWVSTMSDDGILNLAPFSFFNAVAVMPPTLAFTIGYADDERTFKDTYHNITANGECVICIVTEDNAQAMNDTATRVSPDVDEFQYANLTPIESELVKPPRVAESPIQFECKLNQIITLENDRGRSDLVLCSVVLMHIDESVYMDDYKIDQTVLRAVGRMGGSEYTKTREQFTMQRNHIIKD